MENYFGVSDRPGHQTRGDELANWSRLESKGPSTEEDLRRSVTAAPRRWQGTMFIAGAVRVAQLLYQFL